MQVRFISIAAAVLATAASFSSTARAGDRAALHREAVIAAHSMSYGEIGAPPARTEPVSAADRTEARTRRMADGSQAARFVRYGDVETGAPAARPADGPSAMTTVSERRAEVRRANLAGELGGTGEIGHY